MFVARNQAAAAAEVFHIEPVYLRHWPAHACEGNMANGEMMRLLEDCVKIINDNTAQPENFLRQVVWDGETAVERFNTVKERFA